MNKKMLVLDLDGTLTNSEKKITPYTREIIFRMQNAGHTVVLASGRPTPGMLHIAKELELEKFSGYMISFNGGRITDCKSGEVIYQQTLPKDVVPKLFELAEELDIGLVSYDREGIITTEHNDEYIELESRINNLPIKHMKDVVSYIDFPLNKCLGTASPEIAPDMEEEFRKKFGDVVNVGRSEPFFIEITPMGVDKAATIEKLCELTGYTKEDVIACGDGFNDISMIKYAGLGVAMKNAQDAVKEAADYITGSNDEDGVAEVIEKFILD